MSLLLRHPDTGRLLRGAAGHLANDCPAPCACSETLSGTYAMDPALILDCAGCSSGFGCWETRQWDGTFHLHTPCRWLARNQEGYGWGAGQCLQVGSIGLSLPVLELLTSECRWRLTIGCTQGAGSVTLWQGYKLSGVTPAGIYHRDLGCDPRATWEVF